MTISITVKNDAGPSDKNLEVVTVEVTKDGSPEVVVASLPPGQSYSGAVWTDKRIILREVKIDG